MVRPSSPTAEADDLKSSKFEFESQEGHQYKRIAQLVRAGVLYTSGRGFKSHSVYHLQASVA